MKVLFIYNPKSGKGLIRNNVSAIIEIFSNADFDLTVYTTRGSRDGLSKVQERAGEFDLLVCSGGDGTLDEIVTGLMRSGFQRPIGYIPAGSTNDFANSIGIPRAMEQAARTIVNGCPFACDLGRFNDKYFVYVAAFGLFTDVSYQTPQELKNMLGHSAYLIEAAKHLGNMKGCHLRVESEELTAEGEFLIGMIANSDSVGGIKGITGRDVDLNDGLFEVFLIYMPQNLPEWQETISAFVLDESSSRVIRFKTRHIQFTSEEPVSWTLDGEEGGAYTDVTVDNMPSAFTIMVPQDEKN